MPQIIGHLMIFSVFTAAFIALFVAMANDVGIRKTLIVFGAALVLALWIYVAQVLVDL